MIHLVQLLCPSRHCIIAAFYDAARGGNYEDTRDILIKRMDELGVDQFCGICGSMVLTWEVQGTKCTDMKQAMELGRVAEASNLATRKHLDETGQSYKSKLRN